MLAREYGIIDGEFSTLRCVMNRLLKVLGLWLGLWLLVLISLINIMLSSYQTSYKLTCLITLKSLDETECFICRCAAVQVKLFLFKNMCRSSLVKFHIIIIAYKRGYL